MPNLKFFAADSEVLVSGPRQHAGLHPGDEMWSPATPPLSAKLLHFIDAEGKPDWARADDAALGQKLGAFRHTRATPLASARGTEPTCTGLTAWWCREPPDLHP